MKIILSKLNVAVIIAILLMTIFTSCKEEKVVSIKTLLQEMTDRESITRIPTPWYDLKQFSSYDRKTDTVGGKGWFANADYTQFSGIDSAKGRKEYILFNSDGPGAIVRWWMTFAGTGGSEGTVRVYIDGDEKPVLEENVMKLISGHILSGEPLSSSVSPLTEIDRRGHNLYLPIPYSKHCKITLESDYIKINANFRNPNIYYNICYRQYEKETQVISFTKNELENASDLIKQTNEILKLSDTNKETQTIKTLSLSKSFSGQDSLSVRIKRRRAAIKKISLILSAADTAQALRSTVLKITFDGINTVWVPAGDFFGTGYKKTSSLTWNSKVDNETGMETYWLMPFRKNCTVSVINYGGQDVKADLKVELTDYKWKNNSMYFGSAWHEYFRILTAGIENAGGTGRHRDINFVNILGKGVYAGDAVTVFNTAGTWWGEGDEKIFVDGETFPSSIGTGTEDYYGYAWCRSETFSHPFIAQPSGSGNFNPGLSINMRYRDLDAIPFRSSISSNIELWHWAPARINYALTTYWYVKPPYVTNIRPNPYDVDIPVPSGPVLPQ